MLWRAINGKDLTVYEPGNFIRDYSYVQNCVDALILAGISSNTNGKAYIFGSGIGLEFQEMVNEVVEVVHSLTRIRSEIVRVPFPVDEKKMDVGDFVANTSKLCDDTGWYPRIRFVDGLSNTISYYIDRLGEALDE
jgi:dTDP-glucose 4,6-dehydratase/UDP-glucose 4-epimerase